MHYQNILERLVERSRELLGSGLTGVYLHGSMAMGMGMTLDWRNGDHFSQMWHLVKRTNPGT